MRRNIVETDRLDSSDSVALPRKRILCATDLAPRSEHAVRRAAMLARQVDAEVLFVHVVGERQPERLVYLKATRADASDDPGRACHGARARARPGGDPSR